MSSNNNNNNNLNPFDEEAARQQEESNKRAALAGQWRTPPLPAFPTAAATAAAAKAAVAVAPPPVQVSSLPGSTEDYAKALQEAYLRGAEAAAAMAAGLPSHMSCPNFSDAEAKRRQDAAEAPTSSTDPAPLFSAPQPVTTSSAPAPKAPPAPLVPNPLPAAPTPPQPVAAGYAQPQQLASSVPARAMSLPDMTTYAAQQEEEKRQKRLARNRASARLRRLRKKNLVSYIRAERDEKEKGFVIFLERKIGLLPFCRF